MTGRAATWAAVRCLRSEGVRAVTTPASVSRNTAAYASTAPKGPSTVPWEAEVPRLYYLQCSSQGLQQGPSAHQRSLLRGYMPR